MVQVSQLDDRMRSAVKSWHTALWHGAVLKQLPHSSKLPTPKEAAQVKRVLTDHGFSQPHCLHSTCSAPTASSHLMISTAPARAAAAIQQAALSVPRPSEKCPCCTCGEDSVAAWAHIAVWTIPFSMKYVNKKSQFDSKKTTPPKPSMC